MADRIIHIGFPKTGTTFLQKNVFPNLKGIAYHDYKVADELFYETIYLDDLDYDADYNRERIASSFSNDENTLFSFESLAGAPYIYKGVNRSLIPSRLRKIGFNKVIISMRNQCDMLDSLYRQYVVQGGVMKFKDFVDLDEKWKLSIRPFYLGYLEYDKLVEKYVSVFGRENVLLLQQEDLRNNQEDLVAKLVAFTGAKKLMKNKKGPSHESLTNLSIHLLRFCNHFIFTSQKPNNLIWNKINTWFVRRFFAVILDPFLFRFVSSKKSFVNSAMIGKIKSRYEVSNRRLELLLDTAINKKYY
ncbi:MAG: hypothetical protein Tsb0034_26760 [Ekhidna sp.]